MPRKLKPYVLLAALAVTLAAADPAIAQDPEAIHLWQPRISIVWPHDGRGNYAPVERAPLVNLAVDLFAHGTSRSVPADFEPELMNLSVAEGNGMFWPAE